MSLHFFRKVAFGLDVNDSVPEDPLAWAKAQIQSVPDNSWGADLIADELAGAALAAEFCENSKCPWMGIDNIPWTACPMPMPVQNHGPDS